MSRKFYVVIEMSDDEWTGDKHDMATWIDGAMNKDAGQDDIESTVYETLEDFVADNILDVLSEVTP